MNTIYALDIIYNALSCYCEDCVSEDKKEQKDVQKAYQRIAEILLKRKE